MRFSRGKYQSGFTLMEGLFSLAIVFMVLAGLSHTLAQAANVKKNTKYMDLAIEEHHALFTMRSDVLSALSIADPQPGRVSDKLQLTRINPAMSYEVRTDVLSDPLDPFEVSEQVTVQYLVEDGLLKRLSSSSAERLLEARKLEVTLESSAPSLLLIDLELERARVVKKRNLKVAVNAL